MEYFTFISGATGGIGKAFTYRLAGLKCNLFITGRSDEKLLTLKNEVESRYKVKVIYYACDLTSEKERNEMFNFIDNNDIKFDRLVNVAGVDVQKPFSEYTNQKVLFQLRVNAESTVDITYKFLKRKAPQSKIITISSMSGITPMPYFALYSASKSMLTSFFVSLHYELKKEGVSVTTVLPGGVPTRPDLVEEIKSQGLWGKLTAKSPEFVVDKALKASNKNKIKCIPGFYNKLLNFMIKFVPSKISLRYIARRWKTHRKDAF